jgi:hypothetical protein
MKILVPVSSQKAFLKKIVSLNKKARRLGVEEITFDFLSFSEKKKTIITSFEERDVETFSTVRVAEYEINKPDVYQDGWCAVAKITNTEDGPFIDKFDVNFNEKSYKKDPQACDHCHTNRFRLATYIVRHTDGTEKQVGSSCLKFLTHGFSVEAFEFRSLVTIWINEFSEENLNYGGSGSIKLADVHTLISIAEYLYLANNSRWQNNERDPSGYIVTPGTHRIAADQYKTRKYFCCDENNPLVIEAKKNAENIIERAQEFEPAEDDEFGKALIYCAAFNQIPLEKANLIAYLGQYFRNYDYRQEKLRVAATLKHVGTVGEKRIFENLLCEKIFTFQSNYGYRESTVTMFIFRNKDNDVLTWNSSSAKTDLIEEGKTYNIKATIKKHTIYRNIPQTVLTRGKIIS